LGMTSGIAPTLPAYDSGIVGYVRSCCNTRAAAAAAIACKSGLVNGVFTRPPGNIGNNSRGRSD
ncbi:hypothetical protein, partial [Brucella ceti]|uniref:hypothetical protein n=1 Tax=Brucella ceti TaxID=120577 RepID=UPI0035D4CC5D